MRKSKITGARKVHRRVRSLATYVNQPVDATSRKALRPTLNAAKQHIRSADFEDSTGALLKSMTIKRNRFTRRTRRDFRVGPNASFVGERGRKPVKYAHIIEFGSSGNAAGHPGVKPQPFLTPAYYQTRDDVVRIFGRDIGQALEKRAAKLNAKKGS